MASTGRHDLVTPSPPPRPHAGRHSSLLAGLGSGPPSAHPPLGAAAATMMSLGDGDNLRVEFG